MPVQKAGTAVHYYITTIVPNDFPCLTSATVYYLHAATYLGNALFVSGYIGAKTRLQDTRSATCVFASPRFHLAGSSGSLENYTMWSTVSYFRISDTCLLEYWGNAESPGQTSP